MQPLYFASSWLVSFPKQPQMKLGEMLEHVCSLTDALGCKLLLTHYTEWNISEDGCQLLPLIWQVASLQQLDNCIEHLKPYMTLLPYSPVYRKLFQLEPLNIAVLDIDFIMALAEKAKHNAAILNNQPVKFSTEWSIRPLSEKNLLAVWDLISGLDYSLYYRAVKQRQNGSYSIELMLVIPFLSTFIQFKQKLAPFITVDNWIPDYSEVYSANFDITDAVFLNREHLNDFLKLTHQYGTFNRGILGF
jgi:hypothetical protein